MSQPVHRATGDGVAGIILSDWCLAVHAGRAGPQTHCRADAQTVREKARRVRVLVSKKQ
jgi:hypothetical protein